MKKFLFYALSLGFLLPTHAQDSVPSYHVADFQVMYDVMRNRPNTSAEMLFRDGHIAFSLDLDIYHRYSNKQTTISADFGYTYFFRSKLGGWGMHAGWNGAYVPTNAMHGDYLLINHYLFGPEYMVFTKRGNTFNFRWLGGWNYYHSSDRRFLFSFQFDWNIPNLFGLQGLSFMGDYEFMFGPEYSFGGYKILPFASHGEVTLLYNTARLFDGQGTNHWQGRKGMGLFVKLLYTDNYPLGWHSGDNYELNYDVTLTPCLGIRYDF